MNGFCEATSVECTPITDSVNTGRVCKRRLTVRLSSCLRTCNLYANFSKSFYNVNCLKGLFTTVCLLLKKDHYICKSMGFVRHESLKFRDNINGQRFCLKFIKSISNSYRQHSIIAFISQYITGNLVFYEVVIYFSVKDTSSSSLNHS